MDASQYYKKAQELKYDLPFVAMKLAEAAQKLGHKDASALRNEIENKISRRRVHPDPDFYNSAFGCMNSRVVI